MKKHVEVVAAIIQNGEHYLAVQRGEAKFSYTSYKWEFPGGKVEPGESLESAIHRELDEELAIQVTDTSLLITVEHSYPDFDITMHCFVCQVQCRELTLHEHVDSQWLTAGDLKTLDWAAADIPAVDALQKA